MSLGYSQFGPHLHELTAGGLDLGVRRRIGLVINPRTPVYRSIDGLEWNERWKARCHINVRPLTYEETSAAFAARSDRKNKEPGQ